MAKRASGQPASESATPATPAAAPKGDKNPNYHPHAGWSDQAVDQSPIGDGKGIKDVAFSAEEEAALQAMLDGRTEGSVIPEPAAEERRAAKPKAKAEEPAAEDERPRDEHGRFLPKAEDAEPDATEQQVEDGAAQEVPPSDPESPADAAAPSTPVKIKYRAGDGSELEIEEPQIHALLAKAEEALEIQRAAEQQVAQARQAQEQMAQLQMLIRAGRGDAILQLLGVPAQPQQVSAPVQPSAAQPQMDLSGIDWSDPQQIQAGIQRALVAQQQGLQQQFEQRLRAEAEQRQKAEQQAHAQTAWNQFATGVDTLTERAFEAHPAVKGLQGKARAAALRDAHDAVIRAFRTGRFSQQSPAQAIEAIVKQAVNVEALAWAAEHRNTLGQTVKKAQVAKQSLPTAASPKTTPTIQPRARQTAPVPFEDPRQFTDSILAEYAAHTASDNLE